MKRIISIYLLLISAFNANSQSKGIITYDEVMKLLIQTEDTGDKSEIPDNIPREMTLKKLLYFNSEKSIYIRDKNSASSASDIDVKQEGEGPKMIMKIDEPEEQVYCDLINNNKIEQRDLLGRQFLIESPMNRMEWKLTGRQKEVLGFACQEAILKDTSVNLTAWFAPAIPVSSGPNGYGNLPGMILETNRDDGRQIIKAVNYDTNDFDTGVFVKPSKGKKISKDEFRKLADQKRKEMQDENGGDGNIVIKIRH